MAIFPHPYDKLRGSAFHPEEEDLKIIDGLEIFNSRCLLNSFNKKATKTIENTSLIYTAGSDSHFKNEIGNAGVITKTDDFEESIRKKKCSIFGKKSFFYNTILTKGMKIWKKRASG